MREGFHDPKEFAEKVQETVNQLLSKKEKSNTPESNRSPATNVQRKASERRTPNEPSAILSCQITSVEKKRLQATNMKLPKPEMATAVVKKIQKRLFGRNN